MNKIKRLIPNLLTAGNLVGGMLAIIFTLTGRIDLAPWCIFASAIFDFLDGFAARLLNVQNELGKQLDSLADMVTFGVAPGIMVFVLLGGTITHSIDVFSLKEESHYLSLVSQKFDKLSDTDEDGVINEYDLDIDNDGIPNSVEGFEDLDNDGISNCFDLDSDNNGIPDVVESNNLDINYDGYIDDFIDNNDDGLYDNYQIDGVPDIIEMNGVSEILDLDFKGKRFLNYSYLAFLIPVFALFRLAKFNLDTRQTSSFIGLPTPAMTLFFAVIPLLVISGVEGDVLWQQHMASTLINPIFLIISTIIMSVMMVVELPLFALKFKGFGWKGNEIRFIFLTICVGLFATLLFWSIPLIIILYIILSVINNVINKTNEI